MPLKIAMIGHKRVPSRAGGIEVVVGELASRMVAMGNDVTIYNRRDDFVSEAEGGGAANGDFIWKGVHVRSTPTINKAGLAAVSSSFTATLSAIIKRPDVIHYHAEGPCVPLVLAHLLGIRTVATIHGLDWQRAKWGKFASAYIKLGERVAARFADEVIVLSRNTQDYFRETYGRETRFITNGTERLPRFNAEEIKQRWGLTRGSYLLYLSRIVPEKGLHYLIDAYKDINTYKKLVIAGGTLDSPEYAEMIKEMVKDDDRIIMTGFVTGRALQELYSNALLYVLPSDVEGMPLSLLEAMSYGLACVTSDIPECAEVLDGNGVTFPRGDVGALRQVLQELVMDPLRIYDLGRSASRHVGIHYNWDSVTVRTLAVYEEALT